mmetsp:Transcript_13271/g.21644  ORF Transcript_13271/g.21644 Transcript_13271/m.21644 type:complete len:424 (+) Transcript_13271:155-1426(+)
MDKLRKLDKFKGNVCRGVGRLSDFVVHDGEGCWLNTTDGRKLLDFASGIGVTNTGHCHPTVVKAVQKQAATLVHGQVNISYHDKMLELTERLLPKLPGGLDSLFYTNSGAEAVENSIKIAMQATGRHHVVVVQGSYHGRTFGTMSMTTSSRIYRQHFGPLLAGIHKVPFPYEYHGVTTEHCVNELDLLFKQELNPDETAAIIFEPVLGEGGYVPATPEYMVHVKDFCKQHGIMFIADEVQCGFGRTGNMFCSGSDDFGKVSPDILVMAKGIASGYPLAAVAMSQELSEKQFPGSLGGTYSGNAVACAAAIATLDVFEAEGLVENSRVQGERLRKNLNELKSIFPDVIGDVRGLGLMTGVEMKPNTVAKAALSQRCLEHNMILLGCSVFETMRFMPPLTVNAEQIDTATDIFEKVIKEELAASK